MAEDKNIRRRKVRRMMRDELSDEEHKYWKRNRRQARREKARRLYGEEESQAHKKGKRKPKLSHVRE